MSVKRIYPYKNVVMLTASRTVCENFSALKAALLAVKSNWADPFISDFSDRISSALATLLGLDKKKAQRDATTALKQIQKTVLKKLELFKTQVEVEFAAARSKAILDTLGFSMYYANASKRKQSILTQLLMQFRQNMTDELKAELAAVGIAASLTDEITAQADPMAAADAVQESLKGTSALVTDEMQTEFNAIYSQSMGICKIAVKVFKDDPAKKALFTFSKLARQQGS